MGRIPVRSTALLLGHMIVVVMVTSAWVSAQPTGAVGPTDPDEVRAYFDGLISTQMEELRIAGAAVAVVRNGEVLHLGGYGFSDLENRVAVDPEATLFRIASITKTFTATTVMQLVEQGVLDLDADINDYLSFRIPATFDEPITMRHLLTHTAGFEDSFLDVLVLVEDDMVPTSEWLQDHMPARIRPPGSAAAYSNYGLGLAGHIVERAAGLTFAVYLQENVLGPLGMAHTSAYPYPAQHRAAETKGYTYSNGRFVTTPYYLGQPAFEPAGGLMSTASDMARYMNMHLQDGRYVSPDGSVGRVISPESATLMQSTQYTADPRLLGTALGLFDFTDNGQFTLGHSGEAFPTSSLMLLLPDLDVGIFVVYNSEGAAELTNQHLGFQRAVFDHYFPLETATLAGGDASAGAAPVPSGPGVDTERFAGQYRLTRGSYTTYEKFGVLFGSVGLNAAGPRALSLETPWGSFQFAAVDPLYFKEVGGPFALSFREGGDGRITHMFTDLTPMFAFERLRWYETSGFNMALLAVCLTVLLSVVVAGVARLVTRRVDRGASASATSTSDEAEVADNDQVERVRWAEWVMVAAAALALVFVLGVMVWGTAPPLFGIPAAFRIVLAIGVVVAVLTALALVGTWLAWRFRYWRLPMRLHYTIGTIAAVGFVWFLNNWNLLGWRF